jgi:hypothetical protein
MAFTVKKGDLVYASDDTLGFVADVFHPMDTSDPDTGWAAVDVPELGGKVYFTAADVAARDPMVPSVLLRLTYAEATDAAHRRQPPAVAQGTARPEPISPLEVGRPETPDEQAGTSTTGI